MCFKSVRNRDNYQDGKSAKNVLLRFSDVIMNFTGQ